MLLSRRRLVEVVRAEERAGIVGLAPFAHRADPEATTRPVFFAGSVPPRFVWEQHRAHAPSVAGPSPHQRIMGPSERAGATTLELDGPWGLRAVPLAPLQGWSWLFCLVGSCFLVCDRK
jgi:hypothetical protein